MAFDIIVVGGGSAGCAMAGRLSEDGGLNVLLIEAGASDHHGFTKIPAMMGAAVQNPDFDWRYRAEPDPSIGGRSDIWPAGKVLGGGSAINGMMFVRGHRSDFDRWAGEEGAAGWDYQSVLPYFKRMETNERGADDYRGGSGPLRISAGRAQSPLIEAWIDAAVETGLKRSPDINGASAEGVDYAQTTQKNGVRHSAAAAYIDPIRHRKNLRIITGAQVTRIRFQGRRAVGVDYVQHFQERGVDAARGVVICAGALNSPRLLMLSGLGPAQHLQDLGLEVIQSLPGVGQNLQDHVGAQMLHDINAPDMVSEALGLGVLKQALTFAFTRKGVLTSSLGHAVAFARTRGDLAAPNVQLKFAAFGVDLDADGHLNLRKNPSVTTMVSLCRPRSRGSITLRSSDPLAPPVIAYQLLGGGDEDLEQLAEGVQMARAIAARPGFAQYVTGEVRPGSAVSNKEGLRAYVRKAAVPLYHPAGACKMGADPMAVVDPQLKVRGVEGVWVADASVMPSLIAGNTNAAAIMIGEKGADLVKDALA